MKGHSVLSTSYCYRSCGFPRSFHSRISPQSDRLGLPVTSWCHHVHLRNVSTTVANFRRVSRRDVSIPPQKENSSTVVPPTSDRYTFQIDSIINQSVDLATHQKPQINQLQDVTRADERHFPDPGTVQNGPQIVQARGFSAKEEAELIEAQKIFLARLSSQTDWKFVWGLNSYLKRSLLRKDRAMMQRCHTLLVRTLERLLKANRVPACELVDVLSTGQQARTDRSVEMMQCILKFLKLGLNDTSLADASYVVHELGRAIALSNQALHTNLLQVLRAYLNQINDNRANTTPRDMVLVCRGCYKAKFQFTPSLIYTQMKCMQNLDKLENFHLLLLMDTAANGFQALRKDTNDPERGTIFLEALKRELLSRSSLSIRDQLSAFSTLIAAKVNFSEEELQKLDATCCTQALEMNPWLVFRLSTIFDRCKFTNFSFDFAQRLGSVHHTLPARIFHKYLSALLESSQLTSEFLSRVVMYVTMSLDQYSVEDFVSLTHFLTHPNIKEKANVVDLLQQVVERLEVSQRKPSGAECSQLLIDLYRFDVLSPLCQATWARAAYGVIGSLSLKMLANLLVTTAAIHRDTRASREDLQNSDSAKGTMTDDWKELDPRALLNGHCSRALAACSFQDADVRTINIKDSVSLLTSLSRLRLDHSELLVSLVSYFRTKWKSLLIEQPQMLSRAAYAISYLQHSQYDLFQKLALELDSISKDVAPRSVVTPDGSHYDTRHSTLLDLGPTSEHMIRTVWACVMQGSCPHLAIARLYAITPSEIEQLSPKMTICLHQIHAIVAGTRGAEVRAVMPPDSLAALCRFQQTVKPSPLAAAFKDTLKKLMPDHVLSNVITDDGCNVVGTLLLSRDFQLMEWDSLLKDKVQVSATKLSSSGLHPCAMYPMLPASTLFDSPYLHGQSVADARRLLAKGWCVILVPMNKWNEAELDSDRISLIRNLKVIRNSKDLDSAAPVKFALTGRNLVEGDDLEYGGFDGAEHDTDPDETEGR